MMEYLLVPVWAELQIVFVILFLASFLERKGRKEDALWLGIITWLLTTGYGLLGVQGIHGYLMYVLSAILILLTVHGEYGPKGLCLLFFVFLILV